MNQADLIVTRIERARQDRSISVAELARRIDVGRKRLWYVLNGQHPMHVDEFVRLCAVIDVERKLPIAGSPSVLFDRPQENTSGFIKRGRHVDHHD